MWLQNTHIGIDGLIRQINRYVVVLVGIPHVKKDCLIEVFDVNPGLKSFPRVAVRPVSSSYQPDVFAGNQFFNDMPAAVVELTGVYPVPGVIVRQGVGAYH